MQNSNIESIHLLRPFIFTLIKLTRMQHSEMKPPYKCLLYGRTNLVRNKQKRQLSTSLHADNFYPSSLNFLLSLRSIDCSGCQSQARPGGPMVRGSSISPRMFGNNWTQCKRQMGTTTCLKICIKFKWVYYGRAKIFYLLRLVQWFIFCLCRKEHHNK